MAVKCLKAWNDSAFQQMQMEFIKEANAMSLLDHPHIIRLYGVVLSVPMMLVSTQFTDSGVSALKLNSIHFLDSFVTAGTMLCTCSIMCTYMYVHVAGRIM